MGGEQPRPAITESGRLSAEFTNVYQRECRGRSCPCPQAQPLIGVGWVDRDVKGWLVSAHPALRGRRPGHVPVDRLTGLVEEERMGVS